MTVEEPAFWGGLGKSRGGTWGGVPKGWVPDEGVPKGGREG